MQHDGWSVGGDKDGDEGAFQKPLDLIGSLNVGPFELVVDWSLGYFLSFTYLLSDQCKCQKYTFKMFI